MGVASREAAALPPMAGFALALRARVAAASSDRKGRRNSCSTERPEELPAAVPCVTTNVWGERGSYGGWLTWRTGYLALCVGRALERE